MAEKSLQLRIRQMLKNRSSTTCNHCVRQYDDSTCDACFTDRILAEATEHVATLTTQVRRLTEALINCRTWANTLVPDHAISHIHTVIDAALTEGTDG